MMKKIIIFIMIGFTFLVGCSIQATDFKPKNEGQKQDIVQQKSENNHQPIDHASSERKAVISVVEKFGHVLKQVSTLAPEDILKQRIADSYGEFLTPSLLQTWLDNPKKAIGRQVSSPWPDRIDILDVKKMPDNVYQVHGMVIEITSVEKQTGGNAGKRPITLSIKKVNNRWLIDDVVVGKYESEKSIGYKNNEYGFTFILPKSWEDYQIIKDTWKGLGLGDQKENKVAEKGPILFIRHPKWTKENPRQDIPIMVFTISQWKSLQKGEFHIGAAPIGPGELGRNNKYVFALPARYNYAFPEGYKEVEDILNQHPLHPFDISK